MLKRVGTLHLLNLALQFFSNNNLLQLELGLLLGPGDDWEHEEIFTDDDEAVGNDPEEREDLAPEVPAPPEIKQVSLSTLLVRCNL